MPGVIPFHAAVAADGVVVAAGEIDMATAPIFEAAVMEACAGSGDVVIDLRDVTFMDSSGLNVFVRAYKRLGSDGRRIVGLGASVPVRRSIELGGLASVLDLVD